MLLGTRVIDDEGSKFVVRKTYDFTPVEDSVRALRDAGAVGTKDSWFVGRIPGPLISLWLKEAGVSWDNREAVQEIIRRKLLSGEYNTLRPHTGTF